MTIAIPGPIGKPFDGVEIAEPRAGAVWFFYRKGLPEDQSGSPADEAAFSCSQIERSYALTDRQVTLRSLTAFPSDRFTIRERWGISSPKPLAWGPIPRPLLRFALIARFYLRRVSGSTAKQFPAAARKKQALPSPKDARALAWYQLCFAVSGAPAQTGACARRPRPSKATFRASPARAAFQPVSRPL